MIVALSQYLSEDVTGRSRLITNLSGELGSFFHNRNYGFGLHEMVIGIICVNPIFESFFKPRKPIYTKGKEVREIDIPIEVEKCLEFDIKICYEDFRNAGDEESLRMLEKSIIESISVFDTLQIEEFNAKSFSEDLIDFLMSNRKAA